ncbi:MAG TPA: DNA translocase FtsK 4TM domain-containing protein [Candidatus Babeliales bacterium]|nr:DNA translocase FtsK 4TM domain-containing protein [Candidatus Babeliales bacterium]
MVYEWLYRMKSYSFRTVAIILTLFFIACFLALSLWTYCPTDSSLFYQSSEHSSTANKAGFLGAHIAALFYFLFGTSGLFFAIFLFFLTWHFLYYGGVKKIYSQLIGWSLFVMSSCMVGAWYHVCVMRTGFLPGGILGNALVAKTIRFDQFLVGICLHSILLISLILISQASVLKLPNYLMIVFYRLKIFKQFFSIIIMPAKILKKIISHANNSFITLLVGTADQQKNNNPTEILNDAIWQMVSEKNSAQEKKSPPAHHEKIEKKSPIVERKKEAASLYQLPTGSIFSSPDVSKEEMHLAKKHEQLALVLEEKLQRFGIQGRVVGIKAGPVVTLFEYQPHIDAKVSRILALEDDLALALQAISIRIIAPIPGRSLVGFEVANQTRLPVYFSHLLQSSEWQKTTAQLPLILGADTSGNKMIVDLAAMPHLLIAGSTGSGKSVALNAMIVSLLCKKTPEQLRLILIDPKRLEFAAYADIAHLLFPIVDDPKQAGVALKWAVQEMERRYQLLAAAGVRHLYDYQKLCASDASREKLPLIVIIIDELSDLMMVASKEVELRIARIAQMARAAGIHLIVATQRPSVDVITGIIKVNFPSRIAFKVSSKIDSRIILDCAGADKLLGKGDMLYLDAAGQIIRVHGAFISDKEREGVARHIKEQQDVEYCDMNDLVSIQEGDDIDESDQDLYKEVIEFLKSVDEVSISLLQRKFRIGYNRSARIIDTLQAQGLIISTEGGKTRKVLR